MIARSLLAACLVAAALAPAARAESLAPAGMGLLEEALAFGRIDGGPWTGTVEGDRYLLANETDPEAIHFAYVDGSALPERLNMRIRVTLDAEPAGDGTLLTGAGLLYAYRAEPLSYYAVLLTADARLTLLQRTPDGLREVDSIPLDDLDIRVEHELRLVEYADGIAAVVDDQGVIDLYTDAVGTGTIGIVAFGKGRFAFRDFRVTEVRGIFVSAEKTGHGVDRQ